MVSLETISVVFSFFLSLLPSPPVGIRWGFVGDIAGGLLLVFFPVFHFYYTKTVGAFDGDFVGAF